MLQSEYLTILFIPGAGISTATVGVGIVGHITTARGYLQPGDITHLLCSGIELNKSDIIVTEITGDMSTIRRIMTDESTVPTIEVKDGDRAHRSKPVRQPMVRTRNAQTGQAVRVLFQMLNRESVPFSDLS